MITPADLIKKLPRQKITIIKSSGFPSEASQTADNEGHKEDIRQWVYLVLEGNNSFLKCPT